MRTTPKSKEPETRSGMAALGLAMLSVVVGGVVVVWLVDGLIGRSIDRLNGRSIEWSMLKRPGGGSNANQFKQAAAGSITRTLDEGIINRIE
jgi:hypothetical protein